MLESAISVRFQNSGILSPREPLRRYTLQLLEVCLAESETSARGLSVLYCSPLHIRRLNREFRGLDKPTDVLSFPWGDAGEPYLGDLVIALPVAARQAREHKRQAVDEVALLLVHGFLHLLGHDHDTKRKERAMWKETDRLLAAAAGVGKPKLKVKLQ